MPRVKVTVRFESQGPSGNAWALSSLVWSTLKQIDKSLAKEFHEKFHLTECTSYGEVLQKLNEWVYLVDVDGDYDWLESE